MAVGKWVGAFSHEDSLPGLRIAKLFVKQVNIDCCEMISQQFWSYVMSYGIVMFSWGITTKSVYCALLCRKL